MALAAWLWERDVTPGALLRLAGPLGPAWVRTALRFRVARWSLERPLQRELQRELADYVYHVVSSDASGEFLLRQLLRPGAWARAPVGERLAAAAAGGRFAVPVLLVYGTPTDWMDIRAGDALAARLRAAGVRAECAAVGPGGHHLYLEAPSRFNALVEAFVARSAVGSDEGAGGAAAMPRPACTA